MPGEAGMLSESSRLSGVTVLFQGVGPDRIHRLVDLGRLPPPRRCVKKTLSRSGINDSFGLLSVIGCSFQTQTYATIPLGHAVPPQEVRPVIGSNLKYMIAFVSGATVTEKGD